MRWRWPISKRAGDKPNNVSLAAARGAGIDVASAEGIASQKEKRSFFARLFGAGANTDTDEADDAQAKDTKANDKPVAAASMKNVMPKPVAVSYIVPLPSARPKPVAIAQAAPAGANVMFDNRGIWTGAVESGELPPQAITSAPFALAAADPFTTASTGQQAMAYAAPEPGEMPKRASVAPRLPRAAVAKGQSAETDQRRTTFGSPWLRAAMLTPSFTNYMSATP